MASRPGRLKLITCDYGNGDTEGVTRVELGWEDGPIFEGQAEVGETAAKKCEAVVLATVRALENAAENKVSLELLGIETMQAFGHTVLVVAVSSVSDGNVLPLVGACLIEGDIQRGSALAVLDATNRLLERYEN